MEVERGRPELHAWVSAWWMRIGDLERLNEARRRVWPDDAVAFAAADPELRAAGAALAQVAAAEPAPADLAPACRKVRESRTAHWAGWTVFVGHPEVPLANNAAERAEGGSVVGRKNYYGSAAVRAGQFAAVMVSVSETLRLWGLNAQQWWTGYWNACADPGGTAVPDLWRWLPWRRTEAECAALPLVQPRTPPPVTDSS